jgi:hypothetical protein
MEESSGISNMMMSKYFTVGILKEYKYNINDILLFFDSLLQFLDVKKTGAIYFDRAYQRRGVPKSERILKYSKSIPEYLKEYEGKYVECNAVIISGKINKKNIFLMFSTTFDLKENIISYFINFGDIFRVVSDINTKILFEKVKVFIGEDYIEDAEISPYDKTLAEWIKD